MEYPLYILGIPTYHTSDEGFSVLHVCHKRVLQLTNLYNAIENTVRGMVASRLVCSTPHTRHHWFTDTRISSGLNWATRLVCRLKLFYIENTVCNTINAMQYGNVECNTVDIPVDGWFYFLWHHS